MEEIDGIRKWLAEEFPAHGAKHHVPGAVAAVLVGDEVVESATGVLSTRTGLQVSPDSTFQLGSITKVWTATLVMQLVDEGLVDLDSPVRTYLPSFRVADEKASAEITLRHLLCHKGGFIGEVLADTTRDDDASQRYVDEILPTVPQLFPPGEMFSYSSNGYTLLGRVVEVMRGMPWAECLRRLIALPLGIRDLATRADEAILMRAAIGHQLSSSGEQVPSRSWAMYYSEVAGGGSLAMSARSLIEFVRMHLRGGVGPDGTRVLTEASALAMQQPQVDVPLRDFPQQWGLGWSLPKWPGGSVVGHEGDTPFQNAMLWVVPDDGVAVVSLSNCVDYGVYRSDLARPLLRMLAGIEVAQQTAFPASAMPVGNPLRYVGRYEDPEENDFIEVDDDGVLWLTLHTPTETPAWLPRWVTKWWGDQDPEKCQLVHLSDDTFVMSMTLGEGGPVVAFVGADDKGRALFLHRGWAVPRVD